MITTKSELEALVDKALSFDAVALDTEFVWERTYYPSLGLIQVGYPDGSVDLIDATVIEDMSSLGRLLANAGTIKILHDAVQDLVILTRVSNAFPKAIFDSQKAAGFIGLTSSISLCDLLNQVLSIRIDKSETKSDWLARPLTEKQIDYAEEDVCYGVKLMNMMMDKAESLGRTSWVNQEMEYYEDESLYIEADPLSLTPRVKKSGTINKKQKIILRSVGAWRELVARKRNLPRKFILSDENIVYLAKSPPKSCDALMNSKKLSQRFLSRDGKGLWESIEQGLNEELEPLAREENFMHKDDGMEARVDLALAFIKGLSIDSAMDPALIGNRSTITNFVYDSAAGGDQIQSNSLLKNWRKEFCGENLQKLLTGEGSLRVDPEKKLPLFESE
jgi:ribonuclease D